MACIFLPDTVPHLVPKRDMRNLVFTVRNSGRNWGGTICYVARGIKKCLNPSFVQEKPCLLEEPQENTTLETVMKRKLSYTLLIVGLLCQIPAQSS